MKNKTHFNKIYIIESLPGMQLSTGKRLYEDNLVWRGLKIDGLNFELSQPKTASTFFDILQRISIEAHKGVYPIIHIEAHGSKEGLEVASGEFIPWEELRNSLTEINIACKNNLMVVMAACEGIYLFQIVQTIHRAPFCGLIGPKRKVTASELQRDYSSFYSELLESFDGNIALEKLNANSPSDKLYLYAGCNYLFCVVYKHYHFKQCTGSGLQQRIERLVSEAKKDPRVMSLSVRQIRQGLKEQLKGKKEEYFEKYMSNFFMIDLYPENRDRFNIRLNDVVGQSK